MVFDAMRVEEVTEGEKDRRKVKKRSKFIGPGKKKKKDSSKKQLAK